MNVKKQYINSKVFVKALGRKVEVNENNATLLIQHGFDKCFVKPKKKKDAKDKSSSEQSDSSNSNGETNAE